MNGRTDPDEDYVNWLHDVVTAETDVGDVMREEFRKRRLLPIERPMSALRRRRIALLDAKPPSRMKRLTRKARARLHGLRVGLATRRAVKRQRQGHAGQPASPTMALPLPPVTRSEHVTEVPERPLSPWEQIAREIRNRP